MRTNKEVTEPIDMRNRDLSSLPSLSKQVITIIKVPNVRIPRELKDLKIISLSLITSQIANIPVNASRDTEAISIVRVITRTDFHMGFGVSKTTALSLVERPSSNLPATIIIIATRASMPNV